MANLRISSLLMTILAVTFTITAGQAPGDHCHTSAYTVDCGVVQAAKTVLIGGTCNLDGAVKIVGPYMMANGCTCTVKQTAPSKAVFDAYDKCEHLQPAYAALKGMTCLAGKKDGPCVA
ncbi:MAG: hypothetical protein WDW36_007094 [Sanguina aurantia]